MSAHAILTAEAHRELRIRTDRGAALGDAVMSAVVVPDEFRRAQEDYPILFRLDAARDTYTAVALFGFEEGENLFLEGDRWDARGRPLAVEVKPFLIGASPDGQTKQVHLDTASPRIARGQDEGVRVFDDDGRATPYLERIAEQLGLLDAGWQASGDFFAALRRHRLIEPLMVDVTLDAGTDNRLVGFHAVDEERLAELDAAALGELNDAGHLLPLTMAVASLGRLGALVERKRRRMRGG